MAYKGQVAYELQVSLQLFNVVSVIQQHSCQMKHNTVHSIKQHFLQYGRLIMADGTFQCRRFQALSFAQAFFYAFFIKNLASPLPSSFIWCKLHLFIFVYELFLKLFLTYGSHMYFIGLFLLFSDETTQRNL